MTKRVVDYLAQRDGKVVITTTVSSEEASRSSDRDMTSNGVMSELSGLKRLVGNNEISMVRLGPKTYLGLVGGRTQPRPLCIGDTLFLFVPRDQPLAGLAELVTELARQLPADAPWKVANRGGIEASNQEWENIARTLQDMS